MTKIYFQTFLIDTPSEESVKLIKKHLRYWPYVKAFADKSARCIKVRVCIGQVSNQEELHRYVARTRQLIIACLQQYNVVVVPADKDWRFFHSYDASLFLRPDYLLCGFRSFIDELDDTESLINTLNPINL